MKILQGRKQRVREGFTNKGYGMEGVLEKARQEGCLSFFYKHREDDQTERRNWKGLFLQTKGMGKEIYERRGVAVFMKQSTGRRITHEDRRKTEKLSPVG